MVQIAPTDSSEVGDGGASDIRPKKDAELVEDEKEDDGQKKEAKRDGREGGKNTKTDEEKAKANSNNKSRPPPQMVILLWQHFCYYRHHYMKLIISLFLPAVSYAAMYLIVLLVTSQTNFFKLRSIEECQSYKRKISPYSNLLEAPYAYMLNQRDQHEFANLGVRHEEIKFGGCDGNQLSLEDMKRLRDGQQPLGVRSQSSELGQSFLDRINHEYRHRKHIKCQHQIYSTTSGVRRRLETGTQTPDNSIFDRLPPRQRKEFLRRRRLHDMKAVRNEQYQKGCTDCITYSWVNDRNKKRNMMCSLLRGVIVLYPVTTAFARNLVTTLQQRLNQYVELIAESKKIVDDGLNRTNCESPFYSSGTNFKLLLLTLAKFSKCSVDADQRVRGFETKADAEDHVRAIIGKERKNRPNGMDWFFPEKKIWSMIELLDEGSDMKFRMMIPKSKKYRHFSRNLEDFMVGTVGHFDYNLHELFLEVIAEVRTGGPMQESFATQTLGHKCQTANPSDLYRNVLTILLTFFTMFSFLFPPAHLLEQVLIEKSLKMREYLYIMGVGRNHLKMSWILFYLLFLLPMIGYYSFLLPYLPRSVLQNTDKSIFVAFIAVYNMAQISFAYMLSTMMQKPQKTTLLIGCLSSFFWIFTIFNYANKIVPKPKLFLARLASLHPVVPMTLGMNYIGSWEELWLGAKWSHVFAAPFPTDHYGGLGECFCWLLGQTIGYYIIGWYLENVLPGEFGNKQPFYFPLNPRFWVPSKKIHTDEAAEPEQLVEDEVKPKGPLVEPVAEGTVAGVALKKLSKIYPGSKAGVRPLTLNFYRDEITAFLGQNGAGKSTTMNTLVGLITPSGGEARVAGLNIRGQMGAIRRVLGFVPQYDILYPDITVQEHLKFFGWLKGLCSEDIERETHRILTHMGLTYNKRTTCTFLSGGQKRKLSIMTAYMGSPEVDDFHGVVILDEPTSGVDPYSRRNIWDMILERKRGTTTMISTHFMDEADILGDRISIISSGELKCSGTPMFLKNRLTKGFKLAVISTDRIHNNTITQFIQSQLPTVQKIKENERDLTYLIPKDFGQSKLMVEFLKAMEFRKKEIGMDSYGVIEPSVDEVFFVATGIERDDDPGVSDKQHAAAASEEAAEAGGKGKAASIPAKMSGARFWFGQFGVLMQKKLRATVLSPGAIFLQLLLPVSFIILFLLMGNTLIDEMKQKNAYSSGFLRAFFVTGRQQDAPDEFVRNSFRYGFGPRDCGTTDETTAAAKDEAKQGETTSPSIWSNLWSVFAPCSPKPVPERLLEAPFKSLLNRTCGRCSQYFLMNEYCTQKEATNISHGELPGRSAPWLYRLSPKQDVNHWAIRANHSGRIVAGGVFVDSVYKARKGIRQLEAFLNDFAADAADEQGVGKRWIELVKSSIRSKAHMRLYHQQGEKEYMINLWINSYIQRQTGRAYSVEGITEERRFYRYLSQEERQLEMGFIVRLIGQIFVMLCFGFAAMAPAVFVQNETVSGLKRLQLLFGARSEIYWLANYLCDLMLFFAVVAIVSTLMSIFPNTLETIVPTMIVGMIVYGLTSLPFIYTLTFWIRKPSSIIVFCMISFFVFAIMSLALLGLEFTSLECKNRLEDYTKKGENKQLQMLLSVPNELLTNQQRDLKKRLQLEEPNCSIMVIPLLLADFFRIIPAFNLVEILGIANGDAYVQPLLREARTMNNRKLGDEYEKEVLMRFPWSRGHLYRYEVLGRRFVAGIVGAIMYFLLIIFLERGDRRIKGGCCRRAKEGALNPFRLVDEDVNREKDRVEQNEGKRGTGAEEDTDTLVLQDVYKMYPKRLSPAVDNVTVGVAPKECFGLLGINGAGKSTLFRMLTGFEEATSGRATTVDGVDLLRKKNGWARFRHTSYCPQENTLFGSLTSHQHLSMFARFRGIPRPAADQLIDRLIEEVGLATHVGKRAAQLSGGNQRKLQFAIALLDYPKVIFLDEPSSGMDPGARRDAWKCAQRATDVGCSVVLTSHSMEECEALCHRLVIMVAGRFQCIGSPQYLKHKFGNKYTFKIKIQSSEEDEAGGKEDTETGKENYSRTVTADKIHAFIDSHLAGVIILEKHQTLLQYELPSDGLRLSQLFELLNDCRARFPRIEDFSVNQTNLEHVFVGMAQLQEKIKDGFITNMADEAQKNQQAKVMNYNNNMDQQSSTQHRQGASVRFSTPPSVPGVTRDVQLEVSGILSQLSVEQQRVMIGKMKSYSQQLRKSQQEDEIVPAEAEVCLTEVEEDEESFAGSAPLSPHFVSKLVPVEKDYETLHIE